MAEPYNYAAQLGQVDIPGSFARGLQIGDLYHQTTVTRPREEAFVQQQRDAAIAEKQRVQQEQQAREQAYQDRLRELMTKPTSEGYRNFLLEFPEQRDAIKQGWDGYNEDQQKSLLQSMGGAYSALSAGNTSLAIDLVKNRKAALESQGIPTDETDGVLNMLENGHIDSAKSMLGIGLSVALGDKAPDMLKALGGEERDAELQPYAVQKARADASTASTEAEYKPALLGAEIGQRRALTDKTRAEIDNMAEQLQLERDKLETQVELAFEGMDREGVKLTPGMQEKLNGMVTSAVASQQIAERYDKLATEFDKSSAWGGGGARANEFLASQGGYTNSLTALRRQFDSMMASEAIRNLPPGPASDKDIQFAMRGFPNSWDNRQTIVTFLRGMSKINRAKGAFEQGQADWVSSNGNLGTAKRDLNVGGVRVPAGTTFGQFSKSIKAGVNRSETIVPDRSRYGL
jgi:hypothetical protein